ncbi:MAG: hypothetical protein HQL37_09655 [Alphaproteobacteria bacterium]|nr:hypothetical protein [Alphaproteobacteria bacterium]
MAATTTYICQPYLLDRKGILRADTAIPCHSEGMARRRADRLMENKRAAGVDVIRQTADPDAGDYGEPEFLDRLGRVPVLD